jgi:hypothetical protein
VILGVGIKDRAGFGALGDRVVGVLAILDLELVDFLTPFEGAGAKRASLGYDCCFPTLRMPGYPFWMILRSSRSHPRGSMLYLFNTIDLHDSASLYSSRVGSLDEGKLAAATWFATMVSRSGSVDSDGKSGWLAASGTESSRENSGGSWTFEPGCDG